MFVSPDGGLVFASGGLPADLVSRLDVRGGTAVLRILIGAAVHPFSQLARWNDNFPADPDRGNFAAGDQLVHGVTAYTGL